MANIYELAGQYKILENAVELNPDDEELKKLLEEVDDEIEAKADNYAKLIKNLEAEIDGFDKEIKRFSERKTARQNFIKRLKENLMYSMKQTGKTKFKTKLFSFGIQKNGGKAPLVITADVKDMPKELQKITIEPDKEAIRLYIEETGDISYGVITERADSLRIR